MVEIKEAPVEWGKACEEYYKILSLYEQNEIAISRVQHQAMVLAALKFLHSPSVNRDYDYNSIPVEWLTQDEFFCRLFIKVCKPKEKKRALALPSAYQSRSLMTTYIKQNHEYAKYIGMGLYSDIEWLAHMVAWVEPRSLLYVDNHVNRANLNPELARLLFLAIDKIRDKHIRVPYAEKRIDTILHFIPLELGGKRMGRVEDDRTRQADKPPGEYSTSMQIKNMMESPSYNMRIQHNELGFHEFI